MKKHYFIIYAIALVFVLASCKDNKKQIETNQLSKQNTEGSMLDSLDDIVYAVPDPDEILNEILGEDLNLKSGIVNSLDNSSEHFESKSIALNMGVYIADMAYLILQEKTNVATDYFKVIIQMSKDLELGNLQSLAILSSVENNISEKDTLFTIFKESINEIKYELEYSKRNKTLVLIYTGSIIETLYLAINNIDYSNSKIIKEKILEQSIVIDNLHDFFAHFKEDPDMKSTISQIDSVKYYMDKCIVSGSDVSVQKKEQNQLAFKGGKEIDYTKEDFELIKSKIVDLRETIIYN